MGGGYAIQTLKRGGKVTLLYITNGDQNDKTTRREEALEAWTTIGLSGESLIFLEHDNLIGLQNKEEIHRGIEEISDTIKQIDPSVIIIPLYEGGHYQHDVTNYMVSQAMDKVGYTGQVFESPIYNFRYSLRATPEKIFSGMMRLIPGFGYAYPPEPIHHKNLFYLQMTDEEVNLKRHMLSLFKTQVPEDLVDRFGFVDRYQPFHGHDYSKSPFNYTFSFARLLNMFKRWSVLGPVVSKTVKWTKTIHPDPQYEITQIPNS
jgi:LmbE family N-acetylglucosaminyl deacetylase